ncbi:retbindin isoform X2 [Hemicordylus capensis]|nr:retbindin isoform X2 [Hemicordylus capensis]XP_053152969.1 retbindin isoform X2 [Hemicordylus capensis]
MSGSSNTLWILSMAWALTVLWAGAKGMEGHCLPGGKHKASPSPEGQLGVCQLYAENACCSSEVTQDLSKANDIYWNRCGSLSRRCEEHLQQLECFYLCSPIAAQWPHPQRPTAVRAVPLCESFCNQWYEACKEDLTCARNWLTDWRWGPDGNNCSQDCISYGQMYRDGKELCKTIWDDSFTVSKDPCECLTLTTSDPPFSAYSHLVDSDSIEEPDTTKERRKREGRIGPRGLCTGHPLIQRLRRNMQKRSVFMEDAEGSGSGF